MNIKCGTAKCTARCQLAMLGFCSFDRTTVWTSIAYAYRPRSQCMHTFEPFGCELLPARLEHGMLTVAARQQIGHEVEDFIFIQCVEQPLRHHRQL